LVQVAGSDRTIPQEAVEDKIRDVIPKRDLKLIVDDFGVDRSPMLVTALSPVIGYDNASAIEYEANDRDPTSKETAIQSGKSGNERFD
jgi:fumarate hydratase class II